MSRSISLSIDLDSIKDYIEKSHDTEKRVNKQTLARLCVESGKLDSLQFLLEKGCSKKYLIHSAIIKHQKGSLELLLQNGADPNEIAHSQQTPLILCLKHNLLDYAKLLVEYGADLSAPIEIYFFILWGLFFLFYQILLYYAACYGNLEFVKYLVENSSSPMILFPPSLPPILGSIENRYFEITSYLLSRGADPNAPIPASSCSTITSQNGHSSRNVNLKDVKITPLDVAIAKKDGRTVSTLITCGADVDLVDKGKLRQNIKNQLDRYFRTKIVKDHVLEEKLTNLHPQIEIFIKENDSIINKMKLIDDFKSSEIAPIVNNIRHHYLLCAQIVTMIKNIAEPVSNDRQKILDYQFQLLVKDDQNGLEQVFYDDEDEWKKLYMDTIRNLEKRVNSNNSSFSVVKPFAQKCISELRLQLSGLDRIQEEVFEPLTDIPDLDYSQDNQSKRAPLLYLNQLYSKLKLKMEIVYLALNDFHSNSIAIIDGFLNVMNEYLRTINEVNDKSPNSMIDRIGFNSHVMSMIKEANNPKMTVVSKTKMQLDEQRKNFIDFYEAMKNCIMKYMA